MGVQDAADPRAGSRWLASVGPVERLELLAALLRRFNHDFRTPLNTIVGWGHLLKQDSVEATRIRHGAEVIARSARDQALKLDEFIEDGHVIVGGSPSESVPVRIDEALTQAAAGLARNRLQIRIDTDQAVVNGDGQLLQRCLSRLVAVVARRAPESAVIELGVSRADRSICLSIAAPVHDEDWSSSDLLDLRVVTLAAESLGGTLELSAAPGTAAVQLQLPGAMRDK